MTCAGRNRLGAHPLGVDDALHGATTRDALEPRTSLHLHGGYVAPDSDGYPEDTFLPGQEQTFHYPNDQQSGTVWYHDHALGITRLNVYAGLAGCYLVRDEHDTGGVDGPLGTPSPLGQASRSTGADARCRWCSRTRRSWPRAPTSATTCTTPRRGSPSSSATCRW